MGKSIFLTFNETSMKKLTFLLLFYCPILLLAQFGIKAGLNFTDVTNVQSINNQSSSGFNVGVFYGTPDNKVLGSKTELVFSRQGYNYQTNTVTGKVNLDYIMLPQYLCINITKFFQIQVGMQFGYLLNAKADSTNKSVPGLSGSVNNALNFYNRFAYSLGGGIEVHPFMGTLVGARINVSLTNLYKLPDQNSTDIPPSYVPDINIKANLFQIYVGWKFGK
jgi:Outer membrane protein beta-barrel domain